MTHKAQIGRKLAHCNYVFSGANTILLKSVAAKKRLLLRARRGNPLAMTVRYLAKWLTVVVRIVVTKQSP